MAVTTGDQSPDLDLPIGDVDQRRRSALATVAGDAAVGPSTGAPVVAARVFADGCVAVALGGPFDRDAVSRLDEQLEELRRSARIELVVDLGCVTAYPSRLGRVLGRTRIRCLLHGVRIELHRLPPDVEDAVLR